jgi:tetratricopeptide (TPR) repeat protein
MKKYFIFLFPAIFYFFIYVSSSAPTVSDGDTGELAGSAFTLGISHSPGYPLYVLLTKFSSSVLPFGNPAYRTTLSTCIFSVLALYLLGVIVYKFSKDTTFSLVISFLCGATVSVWQESVHTEVFALHCFLIILLFYLILEEKINFPQKMYLISFLLGISFGNQHTVVFIIPSIIILIFQRIAAYKFSSSQCLKFVLLCIIFFITGFLSVYAFLYIRSLREPLYDWEDPQTLRRFIYVVSRGRYGTLQLAQGVTKKLTSLHIINGFKIFFYLLRENFALLGLLVIVSVLMIGLVKELQNFSLLCSYIFFSGPLLFTLSQVDVIGPNIKFILLRFMPSVVVVVLLSVGIGIKHFKKKYFFHVFFLILAAFLFLKNYGVISQRDKFLYYDYVKNISHTLPYNSILFSDRADEFEFVFAYFQRIHRCRADVMYVDCNSGVSRSIYGEQYYTIWGDRRLKIREEVEKRIILEQKDLRHREVFYATFLPNQINILKKKHGLLYKVVSGKENNFSFPWDEIYFLRESKNFNIRDTSFYCSHYALLGDYFLEVDLLKAKECYKHVLFKEPLRRNLLLQIPWRYFNLGDYNLAEKEYLELLKLYPSWVEVLLNLGVVYERLSKYEEAEKCYFTVISLAPENVDAYYNLGVLYWHRGDWRSVKKYFEKVLLLAPYRDDVKRYLEVVEEKLK